MADLSKMLGDVYGEATPKPAEAPEWSDDARLDEAFSGWTPGPSDDASAAERRFFGSRPEEEPGPLADDLATALSEAVLAETSDHAAIDDGPASTEAETEVAAEPAAVEEPQPYRPKTKAFDFSDLNVGSEIYKDVALLRRDPEVEAQPEPVVADAKAAMASVDVEREPEPAPAAVPVAAGPWTREQDDILPRRGRAPRGGLQLSFRRR